MSASLDKLLANPRVWRGRDQAGCRAGLSSGYPELDRHLPGGGWPPDSLTEILTAHYGIGELRLLMPALARLSHATPEQEERFGGRFAGASGETVVVSRQATLPQHLS